MKIVKVKPDDLKLGENPRMILFNSEEDENTFVSQMERAGPEYVETLEVFEINNEEYQLHSGYRRLHAAKRLKWDFVPCYVLTLLPPKEAFYRAIATNYHRNNLSGFDLVMSVVKLQEKYKQTQNQIAKNLGLSQPYVSQLLIINTFPDVLKFLKENGHKRGTLGKAVQLTRIKDKNSRTKILADTDNYTVAQLQNIGSSGGVTEFKPPLESIAEASDDESREAGEYEDHASEDSSVVHPIHTSGESVDDGEDPQENLVDPEKASPDGEPGIEPTPSNAVTPSGYGTRDPPEEKEEVTPESSPSKWKKGYYHPCGTFLEEGKGIVKKRNNHTCKDVLSVGLNVNHKILEMIERKETVDVKNGSILRTDWHINDSYGPFQVDNGRLDESIKTWNQNKLVTGHVVRALENVKQKRENDEIERLKNIEKESLKVGGS